MTHIAAHAAPRGIARALAIGLRPRQWVKNVLVGAAPLAAGRHDGTVVAGTALAFVLFCAAASSVYLVNDVLDAEADRAHPQKRTRPVASGALPVRVALAVSALLAVVSLAVPLLVDRPRLALTLAVYLALSHAYNVGLKHQRVVDMSIVSGGFVLRAIAGGVASDLPLSRWFLIVASFGSLFIVAGKRYAELVVMGDDAHMTRRSLAGYSASYLRFVWSIAAAVTISAYCLWAFEVGDRSGALLPWGPLSVAPFVVGLLRFALDVDSGAAGAPEEVALRDHVLLTLGAIWLLTFALGAFHV
jgi:decaprenyl-phosphate phosphoribosyltransferase